MDAMNRDAALRVLCLEDSALDAELVREALVRGGLEVDMALATEHVRSEELLASSAYDVILADFSLPGFDAHAALALARAASPSTPFVCVSGTIGEEATVELLKQGADDVVLKDRLERLPFAVERAVAGAELRRRGRRAAEEARQPSSTPIRLPARPSAMRSRSFGRCRSTTSTPSTRLTGRSTSANSRRLVRSPSRRSTGGETGSLVPVEVTAAYLEYDGVAYDVGFARDISERKRAAGRARSQRAALPRLLRAGPYRRGRHLAGQGLRRHQPGFPRADRLLAGGAHREILGRAHAPRRPRRRRRPVRARPGRRHRRLSPREALHPQGRRGGRCGPERARRA